MSAAGGVLGALAMLAASQSVPNVIPYVSQLRVGQASSTSRCPTSSRTSTVAASKAVLAKQLLLIGAGIVTIVLL
jgi:hypothetical protein